jgi:hypothetical protein
VPWKLQPERVLRVPRPDDVEAAALGHLDHGVAEGREDAAALGQDAEVVPPGDRPAVDGQALTGRQVDHDAVRAGVPLARRVGEALPLGGEEVQARDSQEAMRVGQPALVLTVPALPLLFVHGSSLSPLRR